MYLEGITHAEAAKSRLERKVVDLFRRCFSRPDITVDDNFFVLGGDSLLATRLLTRLREECDADLPADAIFTCPTPRDFADAILKLATPPVPDGTSSLVPLNRGHRGAPLYLAHATSGNPWVYRSLVEQVQFQRPVLAMRAPDLDWNRDVLSMGEMAQHYVTEIRRLQRRGPYSLAGFSFGGNLTFEIAHRLIADGQQVEQLVMIDTAGPTSVWERLTSREHLLIPIRRRLCRMGRIGRFILDTFGYSSTMGRVFLCFGTGPLTRQEMRWILKVTFPEHTRSFDLNRLSLSELCDVVIGLFKPTLSATEWEYLSRRAPHEDALVLVKAHKVWAKNHWLCIAHRPKTKFPGTIVIYAAEHHVDVLRWQRFSTKPLDVRWVAIPREAHTRFIDPENLHLFVQDFKDLLEPDGDTSRRLHHHSIEGKDAPRV